MYIHCSTTRAHRKIAESSILDQSVKLLSVCSRSMGNTPQIGFKVKNDSDSENEMDKMGLRRAKQTFVFRSSQRVSTTALRIDPNYCCRCR